MKTFEELKRELDQNGYLDIENCSGIYRVYLPENFEVEIKPDTDAIEEYRGRPILYDVGKLKEKYSHISAIKDEDKYLFYIGKADQSRGRGLRKRVTEFVKYGYRLCDNHRGGRAIWQLKNNKELLLEYFECDAPSKVERDLLKAYKDKNEIYPFANWRK